MMAITQDLITESEVVRDVVAWFEKLGFTVIEHCTDDPVPFDDITKCSTHDFLGIDIVAKNGKEIWLIACMYSYHAVRNWTDFNSH